MLCVALLAALSAGCANTPPAQPTDPTLPPLAARPEVDVALYTGTWYQVALYPNRFQRQCVSNTTATYSPVGDGTLEVINRCTTASGETTEAIGLACPDGVTRGTRLAPAQLHVSFAPRWTHWIRWVWAPYWVVQLATDYRYAVVSEPSREYLWVLSRTPQLSEADNQRIRTRLKEQGFDLNRLQMHPQPSAAPPAIDAGKTPG